MKTIKTIITALACSLALTACEDFLNITPEGQIKRDELLNTQEGIEDALYGAYSQLRSQTLYGQELSFSTIEILAQNMCKGTQTNVDMGKYEYTKTNVKGVFESIWTAMYKNISNVNSILTAPLVAEATEYPYTIYKGEALGLRAFMHFDLVRLFAEQITVNPNAEGIPYATEFSLNTPEFESLAKNYEHILADLTEAERLLANEEEHYGESYFMTDRQIHCNLYAVQALLARVYLTMGNKAKAAEYAKKVIDGPSELYAKEEIKKEKLAGVLYPKETLFGIFFAEFYNNVKPLLADYTDYYSLEPRGDIRGFYTDEDVRSEFTVEDLPRGNTTALRLCKLTDTYEHLGNPEARPKELLLGINLIRLPEMYYIMAERWIGENQDSVDYYFNQVLYSRGCESVTSVAKQDILDEYIKEYIGEGQTFYCIKRMNGVITIKNATDNTETTVPKSAYVVPIPDSEYQNRF